MGKRQLSQWTFLNLVNVIVLGVVVAVVSLKVVNVYFGLTALAVWTLIPLGLEFLTLKYKMVHDVLLGKETVLINHGQVLEDKLLETRLTPEDLLSKLRRKNVFQFADVEFAVLEPNGDVSVLLKKNKQPLTAQSTGLIVTQQSVPQTVIMDGEIMDEPLTSLGLNRDWLSTELEKAGVARENVFLAQVDDTGQLYLDLFDDAVTVPKPKTKELAYATLQKCQADCKLYALGTDQPEAKNMYGEAADQLEQVVDELEPLLKR
jgi:uncharacterized membrane protein YcaP (DUF421 family)